MAHAGEDLVGVWLFGSAALGDFDPARSDVDVQAVARRRLPVDARAALAAALSHPALPCPARGLEFVLYAQDELAPPAGPAFQLNLNTGPRMAQHVALDPGEDPGFWFVLDLAIGREHGKALHGPPPAAVLPELPRPVVVAALREALDWYAEQGGAPAETVLSACRALAWLADGHWRSKGAAAAWARERLVDPDVVDRALAVRQGGSAEVTEADARGVLTAAHAALARV